jgi:hypothetical protein
VKKLIPHLLVICGVAAKVKEKTSVVRKEVF